jgi:peroxiredoxin
VALFFGERGSDPLARGMAAPDFSLPSLSGAPVALADLRGRIVLVNFWATWCKPCEDEMPSMERLHRALPPEGFALVAISVDDDEAKVLAFRDELKLTFPILLDPRKTVSTAYQTHRYPESFLLDREGRIVERYVGPRDWGSQAYVDRIRRLVEGKG